VFEGSYEATIENDPNFEAQYGVLIIKFSKYFIFGTTDEDTTKKDKYAALYWKDLTASQVSLSDAYLTGVHHMVNDLQTATTTFTNDTVSTYVDWTYTSPYNKK
jgi:hypothetical protein